MKRYITICISILFLFTSACKKYEDGPLISFRSKEKRLCQTWLLVEREGNGESISVSEPYDKQIYEKDGTYTSIHIEEHGGQIFTEEIKSRWRWSNDKDKIEVESIDNPGVWNAVTIKKLRINELITSFGAWSFKLKPE